MEHLTFYEYERLAIQTAADKSTESSNSAILNTALGLAGEAGEFCDLLKKQLFHGHVSIGSGIPIEDKMKDELGDILWYIQLACFGLNTSMEQVARDNINKLRKRYPNGFDSEKSRARYESRD